MNDEVNKQEEKRLKDLTIVVKFEKLLKLCNEYSKYAERTMNEIEDKEAIKDYHESIVRELVNLNFESSTLYRRFMKKFGDVKTT